ncbi:MAG TPA: serine/threonine protein kinase [Stellaceae bacterium]|nr:serine/threonine protein kinase [Stellaceae bacterium]
MALMDAEPGASSLTVRLGDRYEILPGEPAEAFRSPTADAFRVVDRERPADHLFALVCSAAIPPRGTLLEPLSSIHADTLVKPVRWGVVDWPPLNRRVLALICEQPESRLVATLAEPFQPFGEDELVTLVLPPVMAGLKALFDLGLTHRAIRPTNLFRRAADRRVMLGDCVSGPPAFSQPILFETIESGLAMPSGRGSGTPADDLYALGASLFCLVQGEDSTRDMDPQELLGAKIARGSFNFLQSLTRQPLKMSEPIRGLLADNPRERWALHDLDSWVQRRRVTVRQSAPPKRAARPFEVGGEGHLTARSLACALVRDPGAVSGIIAAGDLDAWLQRSLADPERSAAMALAAADAGGADGASREARLAARVAIALDPAAPVRFSGISCAIDGFGPALAELFRSNEGAAAIAEAITARLPQFWFSVQRTFRPDHAPLLKSFDRMRLLLEDRRPGFGLARMLYELNSGLHCQSPAIERDCVIEARELVPALERAAAAGRLGEPLLDRHVAAFIAARCRSLGADWHDDLGSANPEMRALATLKLLAFLQGLGTWRKAPALAERMAREMPALIARYRGRTRRTRLLANLGRLAGAGNLAALLALAADPAERRQDDLEFRAARSEFASVSRQIAALARAAETRGEEATALGGTIAAVTAALVGAIGALGSIVIAG